jgi:hypothetical protein
LGDESADNDNLIQFPQRLRVVLIEHDGRVYNLTGLIRHLSPQEMRDVDATAPRSGQAVWDEVVRRWPALAAEIVAGVQPTG